MSRVGGAVVFNVVEVLPLHSLALFPLRVGSLCPLPLNLGGLCDPFDQLVPEKVIFT